MNTIFSGKNLFFAALIMTSGLIFSCAGNTAEGTETETETQTIETTQEEPATLEVTPTESTEAVSDSNTTVTEQ